MAVLVSWNNEWIKSTNTLDINPNYTQSILILINNFLSYFTWKNNKNKIIITIFWNHTSVINKISWLINISNILAWFWFYILSRVPHWLFCLLYSRDIRLYKITAPLGCRSRFALDVMCLPQQEAKRTSFRKIRGGGAFYYLSRSK